MVASEPANKHRVPRCTPRMTGCERPTSFSRRTAEYPVNITRSHDAYSPMLQPDDTNAFLEWAVQATALSSPQCVGQ